MVWRDWRDAYGVGAGNACGLFFVSASAAQSCEDARLTVFCAETPWGCTTAVFEDRRDQEEVRIPQDRWR